MQPPTHPPMPRASFAPVASPSTAAVSASVAAYWVLRVGAALCFIGHGAFGFITKEAWLPYFGVVGIPERWAWALMPSVGAIDVLAGMAVLFAPRALPLAYMVVWAFWTALLRPLSGESVFETLERAGNYGVPLAFLVLTAIPSSTRSLLSPHSLVARLDAPSPDESRLARVRRVLTWTTALLLVGHGALGAFYAKSLLVEHYAAIGLPASAAPMIGWFEIALAGIVLWRPVTGLLLFVAAWKVVTESLFFVAGAPVWEFVERAGSYAAPLALAMLTMTAGKDRAGPRLDSRP